RTSQNLQRTTELLHAICNSISHPVFAKDIEGRYQLVNAAMQELIGQPVDMIIGHRDAELFANPTDAETVRAIDVRVLASGTRQVIEERVSLKGHVQAFHVVASPYTDGNGDVLGVIGTWYRVAERGAA
ncbi:MAG: PAS domain-containing protein, partial [Pseudomonadota bacterium]|nr:PAS domain-containing protein [Pseudomonadota bacterium]